jgi:hypothetical protein
MSNALSLGQGRISSSAELGAYPNVKEEETMEENNLLREEGRKSVMCDYINRELQNQLEFGSLEWGMGLRAAATTPISSGSGDRDVKMLPRFSSLPTGRGRELELPRVSSLVAQDQNLDDLLEEIQLSPGPLFSEQQHVQPLSRYHHTTHLGNPAQYLQRPPPAGPSASTVTPALDQPFNNLSFSEELKDSHLMKAASAPIALLQHEHSTDVQVDLYAAALGHACHEQDILQLASVEIGDRVRGSIRSAAKEAEEAGNFHGPPARHHNISHGGFSSASALASPAANEERKLHEPYSFDVDTLAIEMEAVLEIIQVRRRRWR